MATMRDKYVRKMRQGRDQALNYLTKSVPKEAVVLHQWGSKTQNIGFIN